ncbi:OmpA family protein [Paracoccus sp. NSM]|uniref:OmpA family protein n=1 Tax=Paracoccus sp. NSM TaxID=3457784 RepID=UPI004035D2EA
MRRIIHNTTAVAACLSLLVPQLAMAEWRLSDAEAASRAELQAETRPEDAAALEAEREAGLEADDLTCADGAERPCADGVALVTPGGLEVALSETGQIVLAEGDDFYAEPQDGADLNAEAEPEAPVAEAQPEPEPEAEAPQDVAAEPEPEAEAVAEPEPESTPEPEPRPATEEAQDPDDNAEASGTLSDALSRVTGAETADLPSRDELADALADTAQEQEENVTGLAESLAQSLGVQEQGDDNVRLATGQIQRDRAEVLPGLARVLNEEVAAGLAVSSLTCIGGGSAPCDGRAQTPRGVVIETNDRGEYRLAPAPTQMYRVQDGEMVLRAAEEGSEVTEAAREAAEAAAPSSASALEAAEGSGEVTEQQVTEDTARSSSEDFQTNLRDALSGQAAPSGGSGRDNDLARALLLGLGAVAVGSVLANNRQVALSAPDRVVVTRADGSQEVIRDDVALLRQPGSTVTTENFDDGSSRTIVTRADGSRVVTIRDANLQVLRRTLISADGTTTRLIDESDVQAVDVTALPAPAPVPSQTGLNEDELRAALQREANVDRRFTLSQIRNIPEVRALVAPVNIDGITFDTGSAAIRPDQAQQLATLGRIIQEQVRANPREIFLIEGHTDTVGSEAYNLALSDRRAESVALALAEYFAVPPENMVTQGYGERFLLIRAEGDIRENRRASVRRITDLLAQ